jgi:hypothetical protein
MDESKSPLLLEELYVEECEKAIATLREEWEKKP